MSVRQAIETKAGEAQRFLTFSLNGEKYAVPLLKTREVIPMAAITPVPYTPFYFKGVMNLRGQVISVLDLRLKLKLSRAEIGPETAIIILDLFSGGIGVIVDSVDHVLVVRRSEISPMPPVSTSLRPECLLGVVRKDADLILLLDVDTLITREELLGVNKTL